MPEVRCTALARVDLGVTDVERALAFYRDVVGLQEVEPPFAGAVALRCDARPVSLVLFPSRVAGLLRAAWSVDAVTDLDALRMGADARRAAAVDLSRGECAALGLEQGLRIVEPATGVTHELHVATPDTASHRFEPTHTRIARLGHVVVASPDLDASVAFLGEVLDFRVSDRIDGGTTFMRPAASPWHHGFGIGRAGTPRLHHVNFMVSSIDDIGRALHRLGGHDVPIVWGPGRHPPSGSVFLYFLDPDGLTVEYSFGMERFDAHAPRPPRDSPADPRSVDSWGAPRDPRTGAHGAVLQGPTLTPDAPPPPAAIAA